MGKIKLKDRLITKLLLSHILLASVPLLITGLVLINTAQESIKRIVWERNLEFARRASEQIGLTLKQAQEVLRLTSRNPAVYGMNRMAQEMTINGLLREFKVFNRISIIDPQGKMVSSTSFPLSQENFFGEPFFEKAVKGESYISEVYISEEKLPAVIMAEPIVHLDAVIGVLVAEVNLKAMWDLVDSSIIGENGQAFVFDNKGRFIAHSDRRRVYLREYFRQEDIIREISQGRAGQRIYTDVKGQQMIGAYAPLKEMGWGVLIQQPTVEAFAPARKMRVQISLFVLLSILIASALAYFYTQRITRPVKELVSGIKRFSTGDLSYRIPPLGNDEIGMLSEEFNRMADRLDRFQRELRRTERLKTLGKLASVLSHEIRNPLNSMVINLQIIKRELRKEKIDSQKLQTHLDIVVSEIKRMDELVSNFLIIARPPKLEKRKLPIAEIIDETLLAHYPDLLNRNIRLEKDYKVDHLVVPVDKDKIKQVFLNIYLNAVQAMEGGGRLKVELDVVKEGLKGLDRGCSYAVIRFSDTGVGIEPSQLERVFDFYYSTKEGGTGLGLPIAQQIVEEHNGKITVDSKLGKGTIVSIYLPIDEKN